MSLARKHFLKHSAKAAAEVAAEFGTMQSLNAYELQLAQLNNDRSRLKQIQSTESKVKLKKALVPKYIPYVDGIIEANQGIQDEVFMTILVWCIDIADYKKALEMAEFALAHKMVMPDRFARTTAVLVTEEIANAFLKMLKTDATVDIEVLWALEKLIKIDDLSEDEARHRDMPDQVKAKLLIVLAKVEIQSINTEIAKNSGNIDEKLPQWVYHWTRFAKERLERAISLDDKCGGKQDLNNVIKLLSKFPDIATEQTEFLQNTRSFQAVDDQGLLVFKST